MQDVIETTPKSGDIDSWIGDGNAQPRETTSGTDDTRPHSEVSKSLRPVPQANQGAGERSSTSDHGPHANQGAGVDDRVSSSRVASRDDQVVDAGRRPSSRLASKRMDKEKNQTPIKASKTRKRVRFSNKQTYIDEPFDEQKHLRGDEDDTYPEEYVIDHIITHGYAEDGTPYYKEKWYGYTEKRGNPRKIFHDRTS